MYKLFLTLRYLTRKKIVIFPILVVWLCLMMMIIVTSIMGGFVERVRQTNRELLGDIVISNNSAAGWPYYDDLQTDLKKKFPEIDAASPVIHAYGLMNLPSIPAQAPVEVIGVDPVTRSKVSKFREDLFKQYQMPINAAEDLASAGLPKTGAELQKAAGEKFTAVLKQYDTAMDAYIKGRGATVSGTPIAHSPNWNWSILAILTALFAILWLWRKLTTWRFIGALLFLILGLGASALGVFWPVLFPRDLEFLDDARHQAGLALDRADRTQVLAQNLPPEKTFTSKQQLLDILLPPAPSFAVPPEAYPKYGGQEATPKYGCIVGTQIGLFRRDKRGNFDRGTGFDFEKAVLTVVPVSSKGRAQTTHAADEQFVIVDDAYTGVFDVDHSYIYAPFDVVQRMAEMRSDFPPGDPNFIPPRCNELLIKLKDGTTNEQMKIIRARMEDAVADFQQQHETGSYHLDVQTWDEKQAQYLNAVENEKVMQTFILGLMSLVVLVVIFLIFYMIVRDKTRDIGIIKAVGGSEEGVAGIFLTYGLFIGLVGGILGVISGVAFVTHTNEIHEWIYQLTGHMIWDRKVYLFDEIPHTVNPREVALYFVLALLAGVIGALIPAVVAGSEDPVKAVRYE